VIRMIRKGGYFLIHDEYKDHEMKCDFILKNGCDLVGTLFLDEIVWWNDYYRQLEAEINSIVIKQAKAAFKAELKEIAFYRKDPSQFRSIYYIIRRHY